MLLRTRLKTRLGTSTLVNGRRYAIDGDGFCEVAERVDAEKLLSTREWDLAEPVKAKEEPVKQEPVRVKVAPAKAPIPAAVAAPVELPAEVLDVDPPEPPEGEAWPDPVMSMSLGYLRKMAAAYGLRAPSNCKKEKLIAKINEVMFEE